MDHAQQIVGFAAAESVEYFCWCSRCGSHAAVQREAGESASLTPMTFNLRCPRKGKTDDYRLEFLVCSQLSSLATETPEQGLGKAMRVAPSARIPANKVMVRP